MSCAGTHERRAALARSVLICTPTGQLGGLCLAAESRIYYILYVMYKTLAHVLIFGCRFILVKLDMNSVELGLTTLGTQFLSLLSDKFTTYKI